MEIVGARISPREAQQTKKLFLFLLYILLLFLLLRKIKYFENYIFLHI